MESNTTALVIASDTGVHIDWKRLLSQPIEELAPEEQAQALSLCDLVAKALGDRAGKLKPKLRDLTLGERGEQHTEKTRKVTLGDVEIHVTSRDAKVTVNETQIRLLMLEKGHDLSVLFDQKPVLNESRLEQAIAGGMFTDEEIASFTIEGKTPTPSLSVKKHTLGLTKQKLLED